MSSYWTEEMGSRVADVVESFRFAMPLVEEQMIGVIRRFWKI
jgi:hypothetical protein